MKAKNCSGYDRAKGIQKSPINQVINHRFIINRKANQDLRRNKFHEENSIKSDRNNQSNFILITLLIFKRFLFFLIITNQKI